MSIILSEPEGMVDFPTHPEGQFAACCIDIIEHFGVETKYGTKDKIQLRFYTGEQGRTSEGDLVDIWVKHFCNRSFHPDSNLRRFLEAWRGRKFTSEEAGGFDIEKLVGVNALIQVGWNETDKKTYANIVSIMALPKAMPPVQPPEDYVRAKDREDDEDEGGAHRESEPPVTEPDDDLPF